VIETPLSPRVLVVAEDPLVRASLARALTEGGSCAVIADRSYTELDHNQLQREAVEAILFDLGWSDENEGETNVPPLLDRISEMVDLGYGVVVLTGQATQAFLAWQLGAHGVISREARMTQIEIALRAAVDRLLSLDPLFRDQFFPTYDQAGSEIADPLTPRELEVLQLVAEGLPNKTIASRLDVTEHTVKFHINSILRKLGAQSRTEAATIAMRRGLLLL
jgi:DNA-binding NarL/FixJ family response regulator